MEDGVHIEDKSKGFAVVLVQSGKAHQMDLRSTFEDAKIYAFHLAKLMKLEVYYSGQKLHFK